MIDLEITAVVNLSGKASLSLNGTVLLALPPNSSENKNPVFSRDSEVSNLGCAALSLQFSQIFRRVLVHAKE